jgi:TfoX/Sxy family transcriptional regulator of competence genes
VAYDEVLAERVRQIVAELTGGDFTEKKMFGGLAFLVGGHMGATVSRAGGLMLRCDPGQTDAMLAKPHAGPFHMRGTPIDGWLRVDDAGLRSREQLRRWVTRGVRYARELPPA